MADAEIEFHELAAEEYRSARRWYARRNPAAARRFEEAVDHVIRRIAADPEQGIVFRQQFRWMRTRRFRYVIYYEITDDSHVTIYAVAHSRRRLGYWMRRSRS